MTDRIPLDHLTSDQLDALYERAETAGAWRRKAVKRALAISRMTGTIAAVEDLANEEITEQGPWGDGYRAALTDLREALDLFQPRKAMPDAFTAGPPRESSAEVDRLRDALSANLHTTLYADGPTLTEDVAADRNWDLRKAGE